MKPYTLIQNFIIGAFYSVIACGVLILTFAIVFPSKESGNKTEEKFKIVDQYKSCNVIRYTDDTNRWHYFLKCP